MSTPADKIPPSNPRRNLFHTLGAAIRNRFAGVEDPLLTPPQPVASTTIAEEISNINNIFAPAARDVTRFTPQREQPRHVDTIRATPDQGWFHDLTSSAANWMQENNVPSIRDYPPIKLLTMILGEDPISSVGGPSTAISAFARRSPGMMKKFADPGFHNWMIKHGPPRGYFSQIRDYAPETVIDDLWQRYSATPEAQRAAMRGASRRAQEAGARMGRRASDAGAATIPATVATGAAGAAGLAAMGGRDAPTDDVNASDIDTQQLGQIISAYSDPRAAAQQDTLQRAGILGAQRSAYDPSLSEAAYENITPHGYVGHENQLINAARAILGGGASGPRPTENAVREDIWRMYLGKPMETRGVINVSPSRPSVESDSDATYYSIAPVDEGIKEGLPWMVQALTGDSDEEDSPDSWSKVRVDKSGNKYLTIPDTFSGGLGKFKISRGEDENGPYISYYDQWDLDFDEVERSLGAERNIYGDQAPAGVVRSMFSQLTKKTGLKPDDVGRPLEFYNRIYYDPETLEPVERR